MLEVARLVSCESRSDALAPLVRECVFLVRLPNNVRCEHLPDTEFPRNFPRKPPQTVGFGGSRGRKPRQIRRFTSLWLQLSRVRSPSVTLVSDTAGLDTPSPPSTCRSQGLRGTDLPCCSSPMHRSRCENS